jgi:hypothetical protein
MTTSAATARRRRPRLPLDYVRRNRTAPNAVAARSAAAGRTNAAGTLPRRAARVGGLTVAVGSTGAGATVELVDEAGVGAVADVGGAVGAVGGLLAVEAYGGRTWKDTTAGSTVPGQSAPAASVTDAVPSAPGGADVRTVNRSMQSAHSCSLPGGFVGSP